MEVGAGLTLTPTPTLTLTLTLTPGTGAGPPGAAQPVQVVGSGGVGVGRTTPTAFHASSVSPYGYSLSMRTSTGRPCPTMRSNVVLSRSCMLKRGTSVRGRAGRKAGQAPGRRWAGRHEAPALPLHLPGAHAAPKPLLSACCGHEDAVVGSGRRGEREHESRDAPAQHAGWCRWSAWLWLRRSEGGPTRLIAADALAWRRGR